MALPPQDPLSKVFLNDFIHITPIFFRLQFEMNSKITIWLSSVSVCSVITSSSDPSVPEMRGSLPPATKLGQGYVFTRVCDSVHGGGPVSVHAGIPTPWQGDPPSKADTPRQGRPPLRSACWEIRWTSGWYASYRNAILVVNLSLTVFANILARIVVQPF